MAFWNRERDPWEMDPNKRRVAPKASEKKPGLMETLRTGWADWQRQRQEQEAALRLAPEACPWCGKAMEQSFLLSPGNAVYIIHGIPSVKNRSVSLRPESVRRLDTEGFWGTYRTAWYCPDCKKITVNAADVKTEAEKEAAADRHPWLETSQEGETPQEAETSQEE